MSKNKVKLLALDIDGTILDSYGNIPEKNLNAIREAEEAGVFVTLATGRRFRDALPVAKELGLNKTVITHNGALLKCSQTFDIIDASTITSETALDSIRIAKEHGGDALLSTDPYGKGVLLFDKLSDTNLPLQSYIRWSKMLHGAEAEESLKFVNSLPDVLHHHTVIHISFSGECSAMSELKTVLAAELGEDITLLETVYTARNFTLLDVLPGNSSKGSGVETLASKLGVSQQEVMAIGDNFNDIEMLDFAGVPVVMGNHEAFLPIKPEYHTTHKNDEYGVASAIERFILNA